MLQVLFQLLGRQKGQYGLSQGRAVCRGAGPDHRIHPQDLLAVDFVDVQDILVIEQSQVDCLVKSQ
jgi:hypothetical protein